MQIIIYSILVLALTSYSTSFSFRTESTSTCPIKLYNPAEPSLFTGERIYANVETFHPLLDVLADYAKRCHLRLRIKRSYANEQSSSFTHSMRDDQTGLLFQLGEAVELELVDKMNKVICDRMCMRFDSKSMDRVADAKCFIRKMEKDQRFEQDKIHPNIFMIQSKSVRLPKKLDQRRRDLQNSCKSLRREKFF